MDKYGTIGGYVKILVLVLVCISLFVSVSYAQLLHGIVGGGGAASCVISNSTAKLDWNVGTNSGGTAQWYCTRWIPSVNYTITQYIGRWRTYSTGTYTAYMCLLPDSGDAPSGTTCITGTQSVIKTQADYAAYVADGLYHDFAFTLATPFNTNAGTTYWVCHKSSVEFGRLAYHLVNYEKMYYGTAEPATVVWAYVNDFEVWGCNR
jgi:hypothetical protein